jgi:hypothetical protein
VKNLEKRLHFSDAALQACRWFLAASTRAINHIFKVLLNCSEPSSSLHARGPYRAPDVLVAKRNNTSNAIAAFNSGTPVVRSDWLMACWAQAARVPTAKFAWGVDNDDDDDDNDDATLLTQRQLPLRTHTTNIRATTSNLNAPTLKQQSTTNGVARSVNDSLFSLNRLKKTATSWWSRFVGDIEQEQPPVTIEVVDDEASQPPSPVSQHFNHINEENERPSSTTSTDDEGVDVVEIDDPAPSSPAHPAVELSFQFVDIESSQSVSQAVGAATQQAMALSQRFLPCVPVQFDDFAPSQRTRDICRAATRWWRRRRRRLVRPNAASHDIHYGIPRAHKRSARRFARRRRLSSHRHRRRACAADAPVVSSGCTRRTDHR